MCRYNQSKVNQLLTAKPLREAATIDRKKESLKILLYPITIDEVNIIWPLTAWHVFHLAMYGGVCTFVRHHRILSYWGNSVKIPPLRVLGYNTSGASIPLLLLRCARLAYSVERRWIYPHEWTTCIRCVESWGIMDLFIMNGKNMIFEFSTEKQGSDVSEERQEGDE